MRNLCKRVTLGLSNNKCSRQTVTMMKKAQLVSRGDDSEREHDIIYHEPVPAEKLKEVLKASKNAIKRMNGFEAKKEGERA